MAAEVEQRFDDADVTLVDGDVQGRLPTLVAGVEVGAGRGDEFDDRGLIAERRVMDSSVAVRVLDLEVGVASEQNADHLKFKPTVKLQSLMTIEGRGGGRVVTIFDFNSKVHVQNPTR